MEEVSFYASIRKDKINKSGTVPLVVKVYYNGVKVGHPPIGKKRVRLEDWDDNSRRVKSSNPNHALLNSVIATKLSQYESFVLKRQAFNLPFSKHLLLQYLKSENSVDCFFEFALQVISTKLLKDGQPYSDDTKRRYREEVERIKQFKETLKFNEISIAFLTQYKTWLQNSYLKKDKTKLHKNSIWKALGFIRMVYNEAVEKGIVLAQSNPFLQFKVGSYEQDMEKTKYLELDQVQKIEDYLVKNKDSLNDLTYRIGWRFLAMCVCGMRISDAMYLNDSSFNDVGDLQFKPYKTRRHDNNAHVPLTTERQKRYFKTTLNLPLGETDHKSFRSTFNQHLKVLGAMVGITINLTSHVGRHTMGSFLVDAGIETKAAMAILGVKSERVIKGYMHLKESKLKSEANKLGNVM